MVWDATSQNHPEHDFPQLGKVKMADGFSLWVSWIGPNMPRNRWALRGWVDSTADQESQEVLGQTCFHP